jgi:hypothetical protein
LASGQVNTVQEIEIPLQYNEHPFTVIPVSEYGIVLMRERFQEEDLERKSWEILLYDTDMNLYSTFLIESELMFGLYGHTRAGNMVYLLFAGIKDMKKRLYLYQIDLLNKTNTKIPIVTYFPDRVTYFSNFGNSLIIGGRDQGRNSFIIFNPGEKKATVLQGIYEKRSEIFDINIDTTNQLLSIVVTYLNNNRQVSINLRSFDPYGQPVENIRLEPPENINFISARSFIVNNDLRIIGGIFHERKSDSSYGLFLCSVQMDGTKHVKYYSFKETFLILDSLNGPEVNYDPEEIDPFINENNWVASRFYDIGNENVVIIEAYNNQDSYANAGDSKNIFAHHLGLIIGFDDQLRISWINDFRMDNTIANHFKNYIKLYKTDKWLNLYYFYINHLKEKRIDGSKTIKREYHIPLAHTTYKKGEPSNYNNDLSDFQNWYDNYYLFSGVKSFDLVDEPSIFFIQKLEYGP